MNRRPRESPWYWSELSQMEAESFEERQLACPRCGYLMGFAYSDSKGHIKLKCQKCKSISTLNFAYFRRLRGYRRRYMN